VIAQKIKAHCSKFVPDRKQTSHFKYDIKLSIDDMVMQSFMPKQEEDSMNLVCLSLASRLRKLPNKEANKIALNFMKTLNEAEDQLEPEPISKPNT